MYRHTVVFSLFAAPGSEEEAGFLRDAETLLAPIPGVTDFVVSRQVSPKSDLHWQFSMDFADEEAFRGYNDHPVHVAFVDARWGSEVEEFQEYDFIALTADPAKTE